MSKQLTFGRDVKPRVIAFNETHNLKIGIEQEVISEKPGQYRYPVWFAEEKIYSGRTLDGANACITGIIKAYGCKMSVDNTYVVEAPFTSVKEKVDFLKAELDHQVMLVEEYQGDLHEAKAALANIHKMSKLR